MNVTETHEDAPVHVFVHVFYFFRYIEFPTLHFLPWITYCTYSTLFLHPQLVVDMRTAEIHSLRHERAKHLEQLEQLDLTKANLEKMEARVEDLTAQLHKKQEAERCEILSIFFGRSHFLAISNYGIYFINGVYARLSNSST